MLRYRIIISIFSVRMLLINDGRPGQSYICVVVVVVVKKYVLQAACLNIRGTAECSDTLIELMRSPLIRFSDRDTGSSRVTSLFIHLLVCL